MKNWVEKKLDEVCELITCGVAAKPQYVNDGIPFLSAKNVKEGQIIWSGYNCISEKTHKELTKNNKPLVGDILYTRVGSYGEAAVIEDNKEFSVFVSLTLIKVDKSVLNNYFLKHYLNSDFIKRLAKKSISGSGVGNLNVGTVRDFPILLPPLPEQQRIVAILDEAFAAIAKAKANAEQNLKNAKELFESYLQGLFENKGEGWVEKTIDEIIESNIIGLTKNSAEQRSDYEYKYVKMNNITRDNRFDLTKYTCVNATKSEAEKYSLSKGDFLFNTRNSYELVGKTCLFEGSEDEVILYNNNIMRIRFIKTINPHFINYSFTTKEIIKKLDSLKSGTTNVSAIYYKDLKNLKLLIPPLNQQKVIIKKLDVLSAQVKSLEVIYNQKLNDLEELKKSLLQKAFSGELKTAKALV